MLVTIYFFANNSGKGKRFPGGSTCNFKGVEVPCFCRWSKKGGITTTILTDMLKHLTPLTYSPAQTVASHLYFSTATAHDLNYLKYINDPNHKWTVCIGVPYGTALCQVGDSAQQNGNFNMMSVNANLTK